MQFVSKRATFPNSPSFQLSPFERILLIIAVLLLFVSLAGYLYDRHKQTKEVPVVGGTYTEGVVADSPTKVDRIIARLTNIGLTYRDTDGAIQPGLAESWQISDDKKTYTFQIRPGYAAEGILSTIQSSKNNWTGIQITSPSESTLQFVLTDPSNVFLATTAQPLFPYGAYEVAKRDKNETILRANHEFALGTPYIQRIIIKSYDSGDQLIKAAKDGEIDASADFTDSLKGFEEHMIALPRYYVLFFNMTRPTFKKVEDRQRILNGTDGAQLTYTLLTSQTGTASELADNLVQDLATKHITLAVQKKPGVALQKEDIAKREFDLLVYGINYGAIEDYYPFWHSSQATTTGLNISGVKDKDLDALLERAHNEPDDATRIEANKDIETYLNDKALQKILNQEQYRFWVTKSIKGVKYATIADEGNDRFNLMWQWYIKSKMVKP